MTKNLVNDFLFEIKKKNVVVDAIIIKLIIIELEKFCQINKFIIFCSSKL